jgi:hypothetical protein
MEQDDYVSAMPPISPIPIIGHGLFTAAKLKLPCTKGTGSDSPNKGWEQPSSMNAAVCYITAQDVAQLLPPTGPTVTPPFFFPQNPQKDHQDTCNDRGTDFKKLHDDALDAVKYAHTMWKLKAKIKDLKVMALCAIGSPGCLDGPELESDIKGAPMVASYDGNWKKYIEAVAAGVSKCFKEWQDDVMVPGLPWYPAFVAFPSAMAPPMPNVPMPLIACPSSSMTKIVAPDDMKSAMIDALDSDLKDEDPDKQHEVLFESIATVLALAFLLWLPQQQVMLVMGKGPIPTFAPPYVPVGPVVGGDNIAAPGHLMT